jgi:hypothetical protein
MEKSRIKMHRGLRWQRMYTTTNQKHVGAMEEGQDRMHKWQGAGRRCNSIILGAMKLGGGKKLKLNQYIYYKISWSLMLPYPILTASVLLCLASSFSSSSYTAAPAATLLNSSSIRSRTHLAAI